MGTQYTKLVIAACLSFAFSLSIARAAPENDRVYQLDTVGWLKATDNSDGIFGDYLNEQYTRYFSKQTHFVIKTLSGLENVLGKSSEKYSDLVQQAPLLKKIAQKYRLENLIRTRVYKENDSYRFVMEWVYAPKGDVLSSAEFRYQDPKRAEGLEKSEMPAAIEKGLDQLIAKLPFVAQITGIEGDTLTVNIGHDKEIKEGDILVLATLQTVKRHPILKTIEEWRWQAVGRARVEQVEDSLCFAKMIETESGQKPLRFQKVREVLPAPPEAAKDAAQAAHDIPRLGWVAGNIGIGDYSRQVGLPSGGSGRSGGGLVEEIGIDSQIWLNSRFIAQGSLSGNIFKYSPKDLTTGTELPGSYRGTGNQFRLAGGYSFFPMKTIFDSIAWVHAGYKSTHYTLPGSGDYTGSSDFGALFVGLGGQLAIQGLYGVELGLDLGILRSASVKNITFGDASASTNLGLSVAGTYRYLERLQFRLLLKLDSQGMDFPGGESITQKMFSVLPSAMYYF